MTWNVITTPNMDSRYGLPALPDDSIDAIVTDPPAGIGFMGKAWDKDKGGRDAWIEWLRTVMVECLRVLKPGGHALVWALPRTSHWTGMAIELAGFQIRDILSHLNGTGFPKSMDVSKAIDKSLGATPIDLGAPKVHGDGKYQSPRGDAAKAASAGASQSGATVHANATAPATAEAARWAGFGTAIKPAVEHWILARKPPRGTIANNVLTYGTGALNIDGCRVGDDAGWSYPNGAGGNTFHGQDRRTDPEKSSGGRWPPNLLLSHSEGCEPIGERTVRGDSREVGTGTRPSGFVDVGSDSSGGPCGPLYGDESVTAWRCADGCPVAEIDRQSGYLVSGERAASAAYDREREIYGSGMGGFSPSTSSEGGASRFFPTFRPTNHCALCEEDEEGTSGGSSSVADSAEPSSRRMQGTGVSSVQRPAVREREKLIAQAVKSAASLCEKCATFIARSLAPTRHDPGRESQHGQGSISERRRQTLCRMLASVAEPMGHSDTTATTASLNLLSGFARDAIRSIIISEQSEDTGRGQTRFLYQSKPSRGERDAGLEHLAPSSPGGVLGVDDESSTLKSPRAGAGRTGGARNTHNTVKGLDLMSWLCRLITPPGGVVLDPFCGSGSTGCAAVVEGFDFLGLEMSEEYADIARARIRYWEEWEHDQAPLLKAAGVDRKERRQEQLDLIGRASDAVGAMIGALLDGDDE